MRKIKCLLILLITINFIYAEGDVKWHQLVNKPLNPDVTEWQWSWSFGQPNLSVDSSGTIYTVVPSNRGHWDSSPQVKQLSQGNWVDFGPQASPGSTNTRFANLAIDSNGALYVYTKTINNEPSYIKKFDGSNWQDLTKVNTAPNFRLFYLSASSSITNLIYVLALIGPGVNDKIQLAAFDGTEWKTVSAPDDMYSSLDLKVDNLGTPYLAYKDAGGFFQLKALSTGNKWETIYMLNRELGDGNKVLGAKLAFDEKNIPYVAVASDNKLIVQKLVNGTWQQIGGAIDWSSYKDNASYVNLVITKDNNGDNVYVGYTLATDDGSQFKVATLKEDKWEINTVSEHNEGQQLFMTKYGNTLYALVSIRGILMIGEPVIAAVTKHSTP